MEQSISKVVSVDDQKLRDLCRLREEYALEKGKTTQQISAHMRRNGEYLDESRYPNLAAEKALNFILDTYTDNYVLCERVRHYIYLTVRCEDIDSKLMKCTIHTDDVEVLSSIPGIGDLSAIQLMSAIVDIIHNTIEIEHPCQTSNFDATHLLSKMFPISNCRYRLIIDILEDNVIIRNVNEWVGKKTLKKQRLATRRSM